MKGVVDYLILKFDAYYYPIAASAENEIGKTAAELEKRRKFTYRSEVDGRP